MDEDEEDDVSAARADEVEEDELVEVTPHHMRIRKILLDPLARKRNSDNED